MNSNVQNIILGGKNMETILFEQELLNDGMLKLNELKDVLQNEFIDKDKKNVDAKWVRDQIVQAMNSFEEAYDIASRRLAEKAGRIRVANLDDYCYRHYS